MTILVTRLRLLSACALLLGVSALLRAAVPAPPALPARVWRVAVEAEASPFTFADEHGRAAGFAVELLQAVATDRGLKLDLIVLPWPEVLPKFRAGEVDIICNIVDTPERRNFIAFTSTTALLHGALFARRDHAPIDSYAAINGLRIALPRDSRAHDFLKRSSWNVEYVFVASLSECIAAVNEGRADAVFSTDLVARDIVRRRGYTNVVPTQLTFPELDYREHFGVSPGNHALLAELNEGLLSVQRRGLYDQLYERWVGPLQPRELGWRDVRPYTIPLLVFLALILLAFAWQRRMLLRLASQTEALRQSEERLSLVFEGSQDGFWDWNPTDGATLRSPRWYAMLGYEPADVPATHDGFLALVHPDDRAEVDENERSLWQEREHYAHEIRLRAKDGSWKWIYDRGKVVSRDPRTGQPTRLTGTHTDITPRKLAEQESAQLQRRVQESQRLESLGVLAGGIAHDFNNLLTVILGNTSLMQLDRGAPATERLAKIAEAARRAAELCRQLLAYAGKGALSLEPLALNTVITDALHLFQLSAPRAVETQTALSPDLPPVEADPVQLQQVVLNLLLNAADAVPEKGGYIRLATAAVHLLRGELAGALPSPDLPEGTYVRLTVTDNGTGMSAEVRERVFDPFFTTKALGRGLGLLAVLGIVRSLRGGLVLQTAPGQGTVIHIYLPAYRAPTPVAVGEAVAPYFTQARQGVILVADDDPALRPLYTELLARLGYTAVIVADRDSTLSTFAEDPQRYSAVLLDVTVANQNCRDTLLALRRHRADLPCVLVSDTADADSADARQGAEFSAYLQKPFSPEGLIAALRRATHGA